MRPVWTPHCGAPFKRKACFSNFAKQKAQRKENSNKVFLSTPCLSDKEQSGSVLWLLAGFVKSRMRIGFSLVNLMMKLSDSDEEDGLEDEPMSVVWSEEQYGNRADVMFTNWAQRISRNSMQQTLF